jgi:class 3 adenylate cyclase
MSERLNRTSICTVIFINIIDYAQAPVDDQIALKERFNALINEAVKDVAQNDRIILDTGDGAALALLGAPEEALFVALTIRDSVLKDQQQHPKHFFRVRIGINLGPVRVVNDLNGMLNVVGDGINAAQRVMSFAQPNRILVSRSYHEIASRLSSEIAAMFTYYGVKTDKYVREHEVYVVMDGQSDTALLPEEQAGAQRIPEEALTALRKYWIPVMAALVLLAILWGGWVTLSNSGGTAEEAFADEAEEAHSAEPGTAAKEADISGKKTNGQESKTASRPPRRASEPERSKLCSDAQRMLKQCN